MMAEALQTRDAGAYERARELLATLAELSPNDTTIALLLADVERRLNAPPPALRVVANPNPAVSSEAAPFRPPDPPVINALSGAAIASRPAGADTGFAAPRPTTGNPLVPEVIVEEPPTATPLAPPDPQVQARARVETTGAAFAQAPESVRNERLMSYVSAQVELARQYADRGDYQTAIATLDAALRSIDITIEELRDLRDEFVEQEVESRVGIRPRQRR